MSIKEKRNIINMFYKKYLHSKRNEEIAFVVNGESYDYSSPRLTGMFIYKTALFWGVLISWLLANNNSAFSNPVIEFIILLIVAFVCKIIGFQVFYFRQNNSPSHQ